MDRHPKKCDFWSSHLNFTLQIWGVHLQFWIWPSTSWTWMSELDFTIKNFGCTLWLFNIAMENCPFTDDFPIETSIYNGFSIAMLNSQMETIKNRKVTIPSIWDWRFDYPRFGSNYPTLLHFITKNLMWPSTPNGLTATNPRDLGGFGPCLMPMWIAQLKISCCETVINYCVELWDDLLYHQL